MNIEWLTEAHTKIIRLMWVCVACAIVSVVTNVMTTLTLHQAQLAMGKHTDGTHPCPPFCTELVDSR